MNQPLILVDAGQCVECELCSLACSLAKIGLADVKVARVRIVKQWPDHPRLNICRHWRCEGNPCVDACPTQAIELVDGVLAIDHTLCNGCGECVPACPYDAIHIDQSAWKANVCDLCGGAPACVPACPTGALIFEGDRHAHQ